MDSAVIVEYTILPIAPKEEVALSLSVLLPTSELDDEENGDCY
jgi:hypothetical protein